jgi:hypothetical protein
MKRQLITRIVIAVVAPFVVEALLLLPTEPFYGREPSWTILATMALVAGFAVGLLCLWTLASRPVHRVVMALLYWVAITPLLVLWEYRFTVYAFNNWIK